MKNLLGYTILSLLIISQGCKYDVDSFNYTPYHCDQEPIWDSLFITQHLIGKWDWRYRICFAGEPSENVFSGLNLEFFEDGTVNLIENNIIIRTSIWHIISVDGNFKLFTSPGIDQTSGIIYLCENYLYFDELGMDICNNYFKKY